MPAVPLFVSEGLLATNTAHAASAAQILEPHLLAILQSFDQLRSLLPPKLTTRSVLALFLLRITETTGPELIARTGVPVQVEDKHKDHEHCRDGDEI